ncbi:hypothetical protein C8J57DRAFT_1288582 [Mycena rebaudengoi]|nr:hypothetical protein C8J57DRAFT_1288582 [Mycena rebaudengoi]
MSRLVSTTSRSIHGLRSRPTVHGLYRSLVTVPGRVYHHPHIDLAPRPRTSSALSPRDPTATSAPPDFSSDSAGVSRDRHERAEPQSGSIRRIINIVLTSMTIWGAYRILSQWREVGRRAELLERIVREAPDLGTLRQNDDAMANHVYTLCQVILVPHDYAGAAHALARYRAQGDAGTAVIEEVAKEIHNIVELDIGRLKKLLTIALLVHKFVENAGGVASQSAEIAEEPPSDSPDFSSSDSNGESTTYYPPLQ